MRFEALLPPRRWLTLTPLIDIVFLLLIFFMLASHFGRQHAITLQIPAVTGSQDAWQKAILVRVHENGHIDINGRQVDRDGIPARVETLLSAGAGHSVFIRPMVGLPLQELVSVIDQVRAAGADSVSLIR